MEIQVDNTITRTFEYSKRKTLKDGTIKEYTYVGKYQTSTKNVHCNKTKMRARITDCKDKEKLSKLYDYMNEINM